MTYIHVWLPSCSPPNHTFSLSVASVTVGLDQWFSKYGLQTTGGPKVFSGGLQPRNYSHNNTNSLTFVHCADMSMLVPKHWWVTLLVPEHDQCSRTKAYQRSMYPSFLHICSLLPKNVSAETVKIISHIKSWPQEPMNHALKSDWFHHIIKQATTVWGGGDWQESKMVPVISVCFPTPLFSFVFSTRPDEIPCYLAVSLWKMNFKFSTTKLLDHNLFLGWGTACKTFSLFLK